MPDAPAVAIPGDFYIIPSDAARLLGVSVRDLARFQREGQLTDVVTTPGGHRRFNMRQVAQLRERLNGTGG